MKHVLPLAGILLLSLLAPATAANVISDPGFELSPAGTIADNGGIEQWGNFNSTADNFVIQTAIVHSGTQAAQLNTITAGTQGFSILYQNSGDNLTAAEVEGQTWNFSFWVYTDGNGGGSFDYSFPVSNEFNQDQFAPGSAGTLLASELTPGVWQEITGSFSTDNYDLSPNPDPYRIKANFISTNGTSTFYIDDIVVEKVPEPSVALSLIASLSLLGLRRRR